MGAAGAAKCLLHPREGGGEEERGCININMPLQCCTGGWQNGGQGDRKKNVFCLTLVNYPTYLIKNVSITLMFV